jgi:radical SAM superfamily enzyme YgiQ (UPF0313 family)
MPARRWVSSLNLDIKSDRDIRSLGEPDFFCGVTSGCMDSMISNYTATHKKRGQDDLTGGGVNNRRPDLAVIAYSNLVRRYFKKTRPIVLGGMEASLRRLSHYLYASDSIRRSILFDATPQDAQNLHQCNSLSPFIAPFFCRKFPS